MRWVHDASGRFPRRPHYTPEELEHTCAALVAECPMPLSTDALTVLIERHSADLDLYADLPPDIDGVTEFVPDARPRVRVAARLSEDPRRAHRLRTTLAHELGHVVLHDFIWWFDQGLTGDRARELSPRCPRLAGRAASDWMEWQASYAAGALLMPASHVLRNVTGGPLWVRSSAAQLEVRAVAARFEVSAPAARVRLLQLGRLQERPTHVVRAPVPRTRLYTPR